MADLLIGDAESPAASGPTFERRGPVPGRPPTRAATAGPEDARRAADAAASAFPAWSVTGPSAGRAVLLRAADSMEPRAAEFAETMTRETRATAQWGLLNATLAADMLREAAGAVTQITGEVIPSDKPGSLAMAGRLETGICHINGPTVSDEAQMPFGGIKGSGYGRFGGRAGIAEFTDLRWITMEGSQHYPF